MRRFLGCCVLLAFLGALILALPSPPDTLEMKDGRVIKGKYLGGTQNQLRFLVEGKVEQYPAEAILALTFGGDTKSPADKATDPSNQGQDQWKIMTWSDATPEYSKKLRLSGIRDGCMSPPSNCIQEVDELVRSLNVSKVFLSVNELTEETASYARQYSQLSLSHPGLHSVGIDDFTIAYTRSGLAQAAPLLNRFINNLKSKNPNLKFGITLYEYDLSSYELEDSNLPSRIKKRIDYVHLYLGYRKNVPKYENCVQQAKQMFPNAKIIAGSYPYDRISLASCEEHGSAKCSTEEEINLFKTSLEIQARLLRSGTVDWIEFCCIPPGHETDSPEWDDPETCPLERRQACVNNTKRMIEIAVAVLSSELRRSERPRR